MPLTTKLIKEFDYPHEREMFDVLARELGAVSGEQHCSLLGNVSVQGRAVDAIFIRSRAIVVIEMKGHAGEVIMDDNGPWIVGGHTVGDVGMNPQSQCKAYRMAMMDKLRRAWEREQRTERLRWEHASAVVCFRGPIQLDGEVEGPLRLWFHVTDLDRVADVVAGIDNPTLAMTDGVVDWVNMTLSGVRESAAAPRLRFLDHAELRFLEARRRLAAQTGTAQIAANVFRSWVQAARSGHNPLTGASFEMREGIAGLRLYRLAPGFHLAVIASDELTLHLGTIGSDSDVEAWVDSHKGLTIAYDAGSGRIRLTYVNGSLNEASGDLVPSEGALFSQLPGLDLEGLGVPGIARRVLALVTASTPDVEIDEVLEVVRPDVAEALREIITLLRNGPPGAAQARLDLLTGKAIPSTEVADLVNTAAGGSTNSETVVDLLDLPEEILERLFDPVRAQEWMTYLHPGQKRVVDEDFERPAVLRGVSGSGKTCVLIHRAVRLAREGGSVLVLTLNEGLARLINHNLQGLHKDSRAQVMPFYDFLSQCLHFIGLERVFDLYSRHAGMDEATMAFIQNRMGHIEELFQARDESEIRSLWDRFHEDHGPDVFPEMHRLEVYLESQSPGLDYRNYLYEELMLVRSAHRFTDGYATYQGYERRNRAIPLREERRNVVLEVLRRWESFLVHRGCLDDMALTQALLMAMEANGGLPKRMQFDHVLVDEFQDFSTLDLNILRSISNGGPNSLFLTGDSAQKVHSKELNLAKAELGPEERTDRAIRTNYRNTREVLECAAILPKTYPPPSSASDGVEVLDPDFSQRHGPKPQIVPTDDPVGYAWRLAADFIKSGAPGCAFCIASADTRKFPVDEIAGTLPPGLRASSPGEDFTSNPDAVIVSDLAPIKGFEFATVVVVGLSEGIFPPQGTPDEEVWRQALRLYVAMTRAKLECHLLYTGTPSPFLKAFGDFAEWIKASASGLGSPETDVESAGGAQEVPIPDHESPAFLGDLELNGYRLVRIPPKITERRLAAILGIPQTQVALDCQAERLFLSPVSQIPPHVVRVIANRHGAIPFFQDPEENTIPRGERTAEPRFFLPVIQALLRLGGRAAMSEVLDAVLPLVKEILRPVDYERLNSGNRPIRWRNTAQFARNELKEAGLLRHDSPHGIWELTSLGRGYAEQGTLPAELLNRLEATKAREVARLLP